MLTSENKTNQIYYWIFLHGLSTRIKLELTKMLIMCRNEAGRAITNNRTEHRKCCVQFFHWQAVPPASPCCCQTLDFNSETTSGLYCKHCWLGIQYIVPFIFHCLNGKHCTVDFHRVFLPSRLAGSHGLCLHLLLWSCLTSTSNTINYYYYLSYLFHNYSCIYYYCCIYEDVHRCSKS